MLDCTLSPWEATVIDLSSIGHTLRRPILIAGLTGLTLIGASTSTVGDGCCDFDCPWEAPNCTSPCGTELDADYYVDLSCEETNCCHWGQCFIKERNGIGEPCDWICYGDQYAQCAQFSSQCGI